METVLVNFRLPESRYAVLRQCAKRRSLTVSSYIRNCIETALAEAEGESAEEWKAELPAAVREMIGIGGQTSADDKVLREAYHDYLAEKYA